MTVFLLVAFGLSMLTIGVLIGVGLGVSPWWRS